VALVRGQIETKSGEGATGIASAVDDSIARGTENGIPPLVRVHSHCLTGDVLGSTSCDCRAMLEGSLEAIAREERGVFVYLHHTGLGFQIDNRTEEGATLPQIIYHRREQIDRDLRVQRLIQHESGIGAQILTDLGLRRIRVLTNHPRKVVALEGYGLEIATQVPIALKAARREHQVL